MNGRRTQPMSAAALFVTLPLILGEKDERTSFSSSSSSSFSSSSSSSRTLLVWFVLAAVVLPFVVPPIVLISLFFHDVSTPLPSRVETWEWFGAVAGYVAFTVVVFCLVHVSQRTSPVTSWFHNPKRVTMNKSTNANTTTNERTVRFDANSLVAAVFFAFVFAAYGSVADRELEQPWFYAVVAGYFLIYSFGFRFCKTEKMEFKCKFRDGKYVMKMAALVVYVAVALCGVFYELWKTHPDEPNFFVVLCTFLLFSLVVGTIYLVNRERAHVHHYWLPVVFVALFGLNSSHFLGVLQAQALAVHLHGICVYGVESLFGSER